MRLLLLSDIHGHRANARRAFGAQPQAAAVVFLGDGLADFESLSDLFGGRRVAAVAGNCDLGIQKDTNALLAWGGRRILCTHGHLERVKHGLALLAQEAVLREANLVFYGHTHRQKTDYINGLCCFNPGSVREGFYGVVDITAAGVVPVGMRI